MTASRVVRFAYVDKHWKDKDGTRHLLPNWLSVWRDILIVDAGAKTPVQNIDHLQKIQELARDFGMQQAKNMVFTLDRTMSLLDKNVNPRLALEVLMLDLPFTNS